MKSVPACVAAVVVVSLGCSSGAPEEGPSPNERRLRPRPVEATDTTDPRDDQGEAPAIGCPDVNAGVSSAGAGRGVFVSGERRVLATYCGAEADYTSVVSLSTPTLQPIAVGHRTDVGTTVDLGVFAIGDELVFVLYVHETGERFFSGPASRNPDGAVHASVVVRTDGTLIIGFEDLTGGGDADFNDLVIALDGDLEAR